MSTQSEKKKPPQLYITRGATVSHLGRDYQVLRVVDLNVVMAREPSSGEMVMLKIGTLEAPTQLETSRSGAPARDLEDISTEEWEIAEHKLAIIEPLFQSRQRRTREDYRQAAEAAGVSTMTIYRWVNEYRASGTLSALLPARRSGGSGKSRLSKEVLLIIEDYFKTKYLTLQKPSVLISISN
jgi:putative transposase